MANSLSPSFFPTTASAYATYPPPLLPDGYYPAPFPYTFPSYPAPAPDFIPVPVYGTPSLPSAANYQQPFPFTPLPFLYAAVYPYPPPASAYTPASSFYPAQPYGPSTFPYATTSPCPTSEATPIPTNVEPNWPPPAPEPSPTTPTSTPHATSSTPTYDSEQFFPPSPAGKPASALLGRPDQVLGAPLPIDLSFPTPRLLNAISPASNQELHLPHTSTPRSPITSPPMPRKGASSLLELPGLAPLLELPNADSPILTKMEPVLTAPTTAQTWVASQPSPASCAHQKDNLSYSKIKDDEAGVVVQVVADEQVSAKYADRRRLQHKLLNIQAHLDQQQARERTTTNTIRGELAKVKSRASWLAVAMGMQMTDAPVSGSSPTVMYALVPSSVPQSLPVLLLLMLPHRCLVKCQHKAVDMRTVVWVSKSDSEFLCARGKHQFH